MSVICVEHLTRDYGEQKGVFDVSFSIGQGEAFGFLGPNGAGKTTVIRHLMGFLKPQSGICEVGKLDCWANRDEVQKQIGYVPGELSFFEDMSGTEFLRFIAQYRGIGKESRQHELLKRLELDPNTKIRKMSKGTKQKLAITVAFMHDPQILILDEPTSGLDPLMQNRFVELVREEKQRGKTIFLSSHMFEEVERTCDRIGMIRCGELVAVDTVDALRKRYLRSYTVSLSTEQEAEDFAKDFDGVQDGPCVTVSAKLSLEDIFMNYYGGDTKDD